MKVIPASSTAPREAGHYVTSALFLAITLFIVFARAMDQNLNHDEHQFLAPSALLSREGLLPYRDYPLFHAPNLVFLYGAIDYLAPGNLLFGAKMCSVVATWTLCLLLVIITHRRPPFGEPRLRSLGGIVVVILLLADPLFRYTTGKTWNHEVSATLFVGAILLQINALRRNSFWSCCLSGLLSALAAGTRLTYAPALLPLAACCLWLPAPLPRRAVLAASFAAGALIGLLPSLYFLVTVPHPFLFDNFQFPRLALVDPENFRARKTALLSSKLRFFFKEVALPSWALFGAFLCVALPAAVRWIRYRREGLSLAMLVTVVPFVWFGCFAPTRYHYQHAYIFAPLLAMGVAEGLAVCRPAKTRAGLLGLLLALLSIISAVVALSLSTHKDGYKGVSWLADVFDPGEWLSSKARRVGLSIREHSGDCKVLTLGPVWPLEGGLRIYPEFAAGVFGWRISPLLDPHLRQEMHLVAPSDLASFLSADPPGAILTGIEETRFEQPLIDYAKARGFLPNDLSKKRVLWTAPVNNKPANQ